MKPYNRKRKYFQANKEKPQIITTYKIKVSDGKLEKTEQETKKLVFEKPLLIKYFDPALKEQETYDDENYEREFYNIEITEDQMFTFASFREYLQQEYWNEQYIIRSPVCKFKEPERGKEIQIESEVTLNDQQLKPAS